MKVHALRTIVHRGEEEHWEIFASQPFASKGIYRVRHASGKNILSHIWNCLVCRPDYTRPVMYDDLYARLFFCSVLITHNKYISVKIQKCIQA